MEIAKLTRGGIVLICESFERELFQLVFSFWDIHAMVESVGIFILCVISRKGAVANA
jgi:hypothetical protein